MIEDSEYALFICISVAKGLHLSFVKSIGEGKNYHKGLILSVRKTYSQSRRSQPQENRIDLAVFIGQEIEPGVPGLFIS